MAYELEGLASASGLEGAWRQALICLRAAQVLKDETGCPLPPTEQSILHRIFASAAAAISHALGNRTEAFRPAR
jgi:hypothetical protein